MTREEFRDYVDFLRSQDAISYDVYSGLIDGIDTLKEEPKWIPVNERLPENSGRYLAYIVNQHDDKLRYIMTCDYSADGYWNWIPDDECASNNVIAWMPLPKPYEPQESEDKE